VLGLRGTRCAGARFNECQVVSGNEALPSPLSFTEPKPSTGVRQR
jgi:hypothetical protein